MTTRTGQHSPEPMTVQEKFDYLLGEIETAADILEGIEDNDQVDRAQGYLSEAMAWARLDALSLLHRTVEAALLAPVCPLCGRDNTGDPEGCTRDDCPGVAAIAKYEEASK